jgi:hypothetical protein
MLIFLIYILKALMKMIEFGRDFLELFAIKIILLLLNRQKIELMNELFFIL